MRNFEFKYKKNSEIDKTIKYVFHIDGQVVEFSYIDNGTGKDIICVPCQTMCNMSCTFCHLTDYVGKIKLNDLHWMTINEGVHHVVNDLGLGDRELLISYMGCGEPLDNLSFVMTSIKELKRDFTNIRFGMATMLPKKRFVEFFKLMDMVQREKINLKIHLSLHFTNDVDRLQWMPAAMGIEASLDSLNLYQVVTKNKTEIHYTIMDGVNDSFEDIEFLGDNIHKDTTIKFMMYSEKESLDAKKVNADKLALLMDFLKNRGMIVEYYEPPGNDVGASCGQFLLEDT
tara:strand:+ start:202823 stop:203680 length:858 start_codon:yes stop_codon:yes gene_type:complete